MQIKNIELITYKTSGSIGEDGMIEVGEDGFYCRGGYGFKVSTDIGIFDFQIEQNTKGEYIFYDPGWNMYNTNLMDLIKEVFEMNKDYEKTQGNNHNDNHKN